MSFLIAFPSLLLFVLVWVLFFLLLHTFSRFVLPFYAFFFCSSLSLSLTACFHFNCISFYVFFSFYFLLLFPLLSSFCLTSALEPSSVILLKCMPTVCPKVLFSLSWPSSRLVPPGDFTWAWARCLHFPGVSAAMETEDGSRGEEQGNENLPMD